MTDPETASSVYSLIQAGGVLAFAAAVWIELRALRPVVERLTGVMTSLLERDRMRSPTPAPGSLPTAHE